ncbi:MAG TPA: hypothetical protein VFP32_03165 [Candidatus Saccharimonadales bacterium]|nr:hypothetical protein [Candidatus Saccharimonadales bacterium]
METALALPAPEIAQENESSKFAEIMQKANERWWKMQVFLGKNALTKLIAMEGIGTPVDIALMASGLENPLYREPIAAAVDYKVLHKLTEVHDQDQGAPEVSGRLGKAKKIGGTVLMLAAAIGAQKAGLAVAEHAGLAHEFNGGVMLGSKWTAMLGINGVNTLRQKPH